MNRRPTVYAVVSLVLLVLVLTPGCSDGMSSAAGTYELDKEAIKAEVTSEIAALPEGEREMAEAMSGMVLGMIDAMKMSITLNADGTATGSASLPTEGDSTATGTWSLNGDAITITMTGEGGMPESMTGTLKDGVISIKNPDEDMTLVLRRKA